MNNRGEFNATFESSDVDFNAGLGSREEFFNPSFGSTTEIQIPGPPGPPGDKGDSAYEVAVKNGFEGTEEEWLASLKGKDSDESITAEGIEMALGYKPADEKDIPTEEEKESWNNKSEFSGDYDDLSNKPKIPAKISDLENDSDFLTDYTEKDPTVPAWAKQPNKPTYTATDVGADPSGSAAQALKDSKAYTNQQIQAIPTPDVSGQINKHNTNTVAHEDIRLLITDLTTRLNALANSDDTTLDQMAEVVAYIKANRSLIESVTTDKVNVTDIINNLTTNVANKPLSAAQGVVLKNLIDTLQTAVNAIKVPTKTSDLENDSGFLTEHQSLDGYAKTADHYTKTASDNKYQPKGSYLTEVPSEYVTETELTNKGYAKQTEVDSLSEEIADLAVTPQMYGAVGDGVTDDTQALKNALSENSAVFLPKGTYLITQPIDLTQGKSLYSYNQEGVIKYTGSESVVLLGRRSRISGVKILVWSSTVTNVFNTDNRIFSSTNSTLMTEVYDIEVYFADVYNATLINIVASNKDYLGTSGFHNQSYSDIRVAGESKIKYGIKICVSFDEAYEAGVTGALPWITNMRFNHIWLGCPECAIKIHRENNSGTEIDFNSIVRTEHMMFTDIASQCTTDGHVKYFYDVEYCMAEFINCQPWDYHHVTTNNGKYNIIGKNALLSEVNARRSPIDVAEFPSVTAVTPEEDPAFFLDTFFNFQTNIDDTYNYIDMKCERKFNEMEIDEVKVKNIAQTVVEENMAGIWKNVMTDPRTKVYVNKRFSNSGQAWVDASANDCLIIPIQVGTNLVRWQGNSLSVSYKSVFFSNNLTSCVPTLEHDQLTVTTPEGDVYLELDNSAGYTYALIPFQHTEVTMNAENMIVTINEVMGSGALKSVGDHINDIEIHVTPTDKARWDSNAGIGSTFETWTFTLADGSTVTKKVVLA